MKKAFTLLSATLMFAGAMGCSSAPKEETPEAKPVVAAEPAPALEAPAQKIVEPPVSSSLGASSSGRGH